MVFLATHKNKNGGRSTLALKEFGPMLLVLHETELQYRTVQLEAQLGAHHHLCNGRKENKHTHTHPLGTGKQQRTRNGEKKEKKPREGTIAFHAHGLQGRLDFGDLMQMYLFGHCVCTMSKQKANIEGSQRRCKQQEAMGCGKRRGREKKTKKEEKGNKWERKRDLQQHTASPARHPAGFW